MLKHNGPVQPEFSQTDIDIASHCQLFTKVNMADLKTLLKCFQIKEIVHEENELIFQAGAEQSSLGIVMDGEVLVQKEDVSGERLILGTFSQSDLFGEVSAFSGVGRWLNTVVAMTGCRIWLVPVERISSPCAESCFAHQTLIRNMLTIVSQRALNMNKRIHYLQMKRMRRKLAAFLYDAYVQNGNLTFMVSLNREAMADYLNVSRPSMSRELGRMKEEGIIDFYKQAFTIKDLQALRQIEQ